MVITYYANGRCLGARHAFTIRTIIGTSRKKHLEHSITKPGCPENTHNHQVLQHRLLPWGQWNDMRQTQHQFFEINYSRRNLVLLFTLSFICAVLGSWEDRTMSPRDAAMLMSHSQRSYITATLRQPMGEPHRISHTQS